MSPPASAERERGRGRHLAGLGVVLALAFLPGCRQDERGAATPAPDSLAPSATSTPPVDSGGVAAVDSTAAADAMVALRRAVERELGQPVTLEIDKRREDARWTFVTAVARTADRKPIDYTRTKFADAVKDGVFDDWLCALLERAGTGWKVVALEIGATDVPYVDWPDRYGVPSDLVLPPAPAR